MYLNHRFVFAGFKIGDVFQNQVFRWTIGMTHYSFHKELSFDGKRDSIMNRT